jgi:hypothetical protein
MDKRTLKRLIITGFAALNIVILFVSPWVIVGELICAILYLVWLITGECVD